jgi:hypothetical protein
MGLFYSKQLESLLTPPTGMGAIMNDTPQWKIDEWRNEDIVAFRSLVRANRDRVLTLVVEMVRYQDWPARSGMRDSPPR